MGKCCQNPPPLSLPLSDIASSYRGRDMANTHTLFVWMLLAVQEEAPTINHPLAAGMNERIPEDAPPLTSVHSKVRAIKRRAPSAHVRRLPSRNEPTLSITASALHNHNIIREREDEFCCSQSDIYLTQQQEAVLLRRVQICTFSRPDAPFKWIIYLKPISSH